MSAVSAAARALVGVPFRVHGRDAEGLDCVGLAAVSLRAGGFTGEVPTGYRLRGGDPLAVAAQIDGLLARGDGTVAGDLLLCRSGPGQLHLAIRTATGVVHADAGLRRVVERPGALAWPMIAAWRL